MRAPPERRTAVRDAGQGIGNGGQISRLFSEGAHLHHSTPAVISATELAAAVIAARYGLAAPLARTVAHLAQLGGRFA